MHKTLRLIVITVGVAMGAVDASAALIAFYDFGTSGELNGLGGGTGWSGSWSSNTNVTELVGAPGSFFYSVPGGGTVTATGAIQFTGVDDNAITRSLASAQSGDLYISFLAQWAGPTLSIGINDFASWWFDDDVSGPHNIARPNIGLKTNLGGSDTDIMARNGLGFEAYAPDQLVEGTTYFIVGHLLKSTGSTADNYDRYEIWVNPAFGDSNSPENIATSTAAIASFSGLGVRTFNITNDDEVLFGALRIGTTWNDVVPASISAIPEPTSFFVWSLLGLTLTNAAWWRRRSGLLQPGN